MGQAICLPQNRARVRPKRSVEGVRHRELVFREKGSSQIWGINIDTHTHTRRPQSHAEAVLRYTTVVAQPGLRNFSFILSKEKLLQLLGFLAATQTCACAVCSTLVRFVGQKGLMKTLFNSSDTLIRCSFYRNNKAKSHVQWGDVYWTFGEGVSSVRTFPDMREASGQSSLCFLRRVTLRFSVPWQAVFFVF